jgi:hypothetical protein
MNNYDQQNNGQTHTKNELTLQNSQRRPRRPTRHHRKSTDMKLQTTTRQLLYRTNPNETTSSHTLLTEYQPRTLHGLLLRHLTQT